MDLIPLNLLRRRLSCAMMNCLVWKARKKRYVFAMAHIEMVAYMKGIISIVFLVLWCLFFLLQETLSIDDLDAREARLGEQFPLTEIPESEVDESIAVERRKQLALRAMAVGRIRKKRQRLEKDLQEEEERKEDSRMRAENTETWLNARKEKRMVFLFMAFSFYFGSSIFSSPFAAFLVMVLSRSKYDWVSLFFLVSISLQLLEEKICRRTKRKVELTDRRSLANQLRLQAMAQASSARENECVLAKYFPFGHLRNWTSSFLLCLYIDWDICLCLVLSFLPLVSLTRSEIEANFGARDEDWQVYKIIVSRNLCFFVVVVYVENMVFMFRIKKNSGLILPYISSGCE